MVIWVIIITQVLCAVVKHLSVNSEIRRNRILTGVCQADTGIFFGGKDMIIVLKKNADEKKVEELKESFLEKGLKLHISQGMNTLLIGLIGDTTELDEEQIGAMEVVESVKRIREPYKKANKSMHPQDTIVDVCGRKIGSGNF